MLDSLSLWLHETPLGETLLTMLISMLPVVELRGGLPAGVAMGLPIPVAFAASLVGNMIPVPFIFLFARKILEWGADKPVIGKFFTFCLEKGHKGGQKLNRKITKEQIADAVAASVSHLPGVDMAQVRRLFLSMTGTAASDEFDQHDQ